MGIPSGVVKYVLSGNLPGGEVFQTAWWEKWDGSQVINDSLATTIAASGPFTTLTGVLKTGINTSSNYTALDIYLYTGSQAATSHGHAGFLVTGTGTTPHPNQISLVVTLRTATPGRSGRGRMYLPANGIGMTTTNGQMNSSTVDSIVDALGVWFGVRNSIVPSVAVVSQTSTAYHLVTSVDADYVGDVQRRRARKQVSVRHSHGV